MVKKKNTQIMRTKASTLLPGSPKMIIIIIIIRIQRDMKRAAFEWSEESGIKQPAAALP